MSVRKTKFKKNQSNNNELSTELVVTPLGELLETETYMPVLGLRLDLDEIRGLASFVWITELNENDEYYE